MWNALRIAACLAIFGVTGCARPLTQAEESFARDLFGSDLDVSKVEVAQGVGILPLYRTEVSQTTRVQGTDKACLRTPQPRGAQPPQAFAFHNRVHFETGLYSSDMVINWPDQLRVPQALVLAHELTHVWQWQNRARTGYSPRRAVAESWRLADPYFSGAGEAAFLSLGYEQQAAIVEDFVCFTFANAGHPRRQELRDILEPVLPVAEFEAALGR